MVPSVLEEGLGAGGLHTAKGSSSESSVRRKRRATAGLLQRFLGRPDKAPHGEHQAPKAPGWVFSPGLPEADSVGAQKLYDRGRFPSTLLPSRDMCRCFWADPACLCSRPQPQLRGSRPWGKTCWRSPEPPPDRRVHSQHGSEPPRGKRRQPCPVKLKALLARSQVRLQ